MDWISICVVPSNIRNHESHDLELKLDILNLIILPHFFNLMCHELLLINVKTSLSYVSLLTAYDNHVELK